MKKIVRGEDMNKSIVLITGGDGNIAQKIVKK